MKEGGYFNNRQLIYIIVNCLKRFIKLAIVVEIVSTIINNYKILEKE